MLRDGLRRSMQFYHALGRWVIAPIVLGALVIAGGILLYRREVNFDTFLNYFALGLLIFVIITLFYGIIAIHDVPYEIAKRRDHPHQDAIHAAGWVSLFTLHALWPFLWIWAMTYRPDRGWGFKQVAENEAELSHKFDSLLRRVEELEDRSNGAVLPSRSGPQQLRQMEAKAPSGAEAADVKSGAN